MYLGDKGKAMRYGAMQSLREKLMPSAKIFGVSSEKYHCQIFIFLRWIFPSLIQWYFFSVVCSMPYIRKLMRYGVMQSLREKCLRIVKILGIHSLKNPPFRQQYIVLRLNFSLLDPFVLSPDVFHRLTSWLFHNLILGHNSTARFV